MTAGSPPKISAEFRGRTRLLCQRVGAEGEQLLAALQKIVTPLERRRESHPKLRYEHVVEALRAWHNTIPSQFRLALDIETHPARKPTALVVKEQRLLCGERFRRDWNTPEPSIAIAEITVTTTTGKLTVTTESHALVSAHAVGRWLQRSRDQSDRALMRDLGVLVGQQAEIVPTADGIWFAELIASVNGLGERRLVWRVRTYRDAEEISGDQPFVRPPKRAPIVGVVA